MLGKRFYKDGFSQEEYSACASWCNANGATIVDQGEYYECVPIPDPTQAELNANEIAALKRNLEDTDYMAIKYAEGIIGAEEYEPTKQQRQAWRNRINELEMVANE